MLSGGSLDPAFGTGGAVRANYGPGSIAHAVAIQADGKLVVGGTGARVGDPRDTSFGLLRYNTNGTLDTSFGRGGQFNLDFGPYDDAATDVKIQPDGKIVAVTADFRSGSLTASRFAVVRVNANGTLDAGFGLDGVASHDAVAGAFEGPSALVIQPDGKLVAVGTSVGSPRNLIVLVRWHANGVLDTGFGSNGVVTTAGNAATDAVLQSDGKIVVAANVGSSAALVRYHTDGRLDGTFGSGGFSTTDFGGRVAVARAVAAQPADGKLVVTGYVAPDPGGAAADFALARFHHNGSLDAGFGTNGITRTDFAGGRDEAHALVPLPGGDIVVAGSTLVGTPGQPGTHGDVALARYHANGTLKTTFGIGGRATTSFGAGTFAVARAIIPDSVNNLVVAGSDGAGGGHIVLARYRLVSPSRSPVLALRSGAGGDDARDFGFAVAAAGNNVLVGDPIEAGPVTIRDIGQHTVLAHIEGRGGAYLFRGLDGGLLQSYHPSQRLAAVIVEHARAGFGFSLAASLSTVIIGAPFSVHGGALTVSRNQGALYAFPPGVSSFLSSDGESFYGTSLAVIPGRSLAFAGSPGPGTGRFFSGIPGGRVFFVGLDPQTVLSTPFRWGMEPTEEEGSVDAGFGESVAAGEFNGAVTLFAGAPGANRSLAPLYAGLSGDIIDVGAVQITPMASGIDLLASVLLYSPTPTTGASFGSALAARGNRLLVGAPGGVGAVYLFEVPPGVDPPERSRTARRAFANPTPAGQDHFGFSLALVGDYAVIGAPNDDTLAPNAGAVYVFHATSGQLLETLFSPAPRAGGRFGFSLAALGDNRIIVGAPDDGYFEKGAAYVFDITQPDADADGVADALEDAVAPNGDGNGDGIPDREQAHVTSLPNARDGGYVTLASPAGTRLVDVRLSPTPPPGAPPRPLDTDFPLGFLSFAIEGLAAGGSATVEMTFHGGPALNAYFKLNPATSQWFDFAFDGTTGARFPLNGNRLSVAFVDGGRGDTDPTAGRIVDPGGPAFKADPRALLVTALYHELLGRAPDRLGLEGWVQHLGAGGGRLQVVQAIWASPEHRGRQVDRLYATYLRRRAEPAGRAAWVEALVAGMTETTLARILLTSAEYTAAHADASSFVTALYRDVLGREPDAAGRAAWVEEAQKERGRTVVAGAFLGSPEAHRQLVDRYYTTLLGRAAEPPGRQAWSDFLDSGRGTGAAVGQAILASEEYFTRARTSLF